MTFNDDPDDQNKRIEKLRQELEALCGSTTSYESMPADMEEEFLRHVLEYERAEPISLFRLLENSGVEIPAADTLDWTSPSTYDFNTPLYSGGSKLREVVTKMAGLGAYLLHTNHLSDRELYAITMVCVKKRSSSPRIPATLTCSISLVTAATKIILSISSTTPTMNIESNGPTIGQSIQCHHTKILPSTEICRCPNRHSVSQF
jgi:hypothetical protein